MIGRMRSIFKQLPKLFTRAKKPRAGIDIFELLGREPVCLDTPELQRSDAAFIAQDPKLIDQRPLLREASLKVLQLFLSQGFLLLHFGESLLLRAIQTTQRCRRPTG